MQIRSVRHPDDLDELHRLLEQCRLADGHEAIGEHKYLGLVAGAADRSVGWAFEVDRQLVAYSHLEPRPDGDGWVLEAAIHPDHRHPDLIREVLQSSVAWATGAGGGEIRVWVYHPAVEESVRELGFRQERELLQMRARLPPARTPTVPTGLRLASFRMGSDEDSWIEVNNRAFAGHPENGAWTTDLLTHRFRQDWFDPSGLLMAWEGSALTGFCWTKLHPGDLGEIYVIAVDPRYQGRSLGSWLTLEGLWYLHRRRDAKTAMLYVDAADGPVVGMYERLGFELDHIDRSFTRQSVG